MQAPRPAIPITKSVKAVLGIVAGAALLTGTAMTTAARAEVVSGRLLWVYEKADTLSPTSPLPFATMWPEDVKALRSDASRHVPLDPKRRPTFSYFIAKMPLSDGSTVAVTSHFRRCYLVRIESTEARNYYVCQLRAALIRDGKVRARADTATVESKADFSNIAGIITDLATVTVFFGNSLTPPTDAAARDGSDDDNRQDHDFTTVSYDSARKTISLTLTKDGKIEPPVAVMTLK
jgi:hypothetical protein